PRRVGPEDLARCGGQPDGHRLRRVTRDRRGDQTYVTTSKIQLEENANELCIRATLRHSPSKVVDRHAADQAADSCNLTRVRLPRCCGSGAGGCRTDSPGQRRQTYFLRTGSDRAKQLQVWRYGRDRPGCQDDSVGGALEIAHWRRTGHSCRCPESSPALLWFLRRQMGDDQRT